MIKPASPYNYLDLSSQSKKLLKEIDALQLEFAKLVIEYDHLITTVIPDVESEYQILIGAKEYELFCLETDVARTKRKISLIQMALNKGENPDIKAIELTLDVEFKEWLDKIQQLLDKLNAAKRIGNAERLSSEDSIKLQKLYRDLIKKLHPDINPNLTPEEKMLWLRVVSAYKRGDLTEMEVLTTLIDKEADIDKINNPSLLDEIHINLKQKVKRLILKIEELNSKHPLNMQESLNDPTWVKNKQNELSKRIELLLQKKQELTVIVNEMVRK